ncbi:hypothetical protein FRC12_015496 [Ceratobasidium sp. 428]|nr:hypothetical protein FRC12_015496 [Ceratobasidium sp. 428]
MNGPPATRHTDQKGAHSPLDDGLHQGIPSLSSFVLPLNAGDQQPLQPSGKDSMNPTLTDTETIVKMPPHFLSNLDCDNSIIGDHTTPSSSKEDALTPSSSPMPHSNIGVVDITASNVIRGPAVIEASFLGKHRDANDFATPRPTKRPNRTAAENGIVGQQHLDPGYNPLPLSETHTYPAQEYSSITPSSILSAGSRISPGINRSLKQLTYLPTADYYDSVRVGVLEPPVLEAGPFSTPDYAQMYGSLSPALSGSSPAHSSDSHATGGIKKRLWYAKDAGLRIVLVLSKGGAQIPAVGIQHRSQRELSKRELNEKDQLTTFILRNNTDGLPDSTSDDKVQDLRLHHLLGMPRKAGTHDLTYARSRSALVVANEIIKPAEVQILFRIFFEKLNPSLAILDPTMHTAGFVLNRSPFLFATICAISSRYYRENPQLYPVAMRLAEQSASKVLVGGQKAVEIVQAYILMSAYPIPTHLREEDQTRMYLSLAVKMAVELRLHLPAAGTSTGEERERDHLNKNRTWLICFNMIQSGNIQFGWPSTIAENGVMHDLQGWHKLSKHNTTTDIHLTAYTQVRTIVGRFLANIPPNYETTNSNLNLLAMTSSSNEELLTLECETRELFEGESDHAASFGYQQALLHGLGHSKTFSNQCFEAASKAVEIVIQNLAPNGWLMYALDEHFISISFAAAFLLRMLQSPFASALNPAQSSAIIPLVTDLTRVLESNQVAIDDQHSPRLYSRFLNGLIAKQAWTDNFLLPGFNASFPDSAGGPPVDMRQWYTMNRGAIFPGVVTNRGIGASQELDLVPNPESAQSPNDLHLQEKRDLNGSVEPGWSPQATRFMVSI